jgi:tRNA dimethylallyltransferase
MTLETKEKNKIVVIMGPTAGGKSALAEQLAEKFHGIVINADARQVYAGLPVLTAAASPDVSHKLYQFLPLDHTFSFAQYAQMADREIRAACTAGFVPIIVGGTGLYIDALLGEVSAAPQVSPDVRARVGALRPDQALQHLYDEDIAAAVQIDVKNPRRVARALEVLWETGRSFLSFGKGAPASYDALLIGWDPGREKVLENIRARVADMWARGAVAEVRAARVAGFGPDAPGMQTIGVPEISAFLDGALGEIGAQELLITRTAQYAKRQLTWFKRNKKIVWYTTIDEICHSLHDFLHNDSPAP